MSWDQQLSQLQQLANELGDERLVELGKALDLAIRKLDNERYRLEAEVERLKAHESGRDLVYEDPVYWQKKGSEKEGPFCQVCWDSKSKRVHLHREEDKGWSCKVCGNSFSDEGSSPFRYNPPF